MITEETIALANKAGWSVVDLLGGFGTRLERFTNLVAEKEREDCIKMLEATDLSGLKDNPALQSWFATVLLTCIKAIRIRGEQ